MPRLNTPTYLHHHYQLKELWLIHQNAFSYLSPSDQLALHTYFLFASDKTEADLLEHRRNVYKLDPTLPQRAGRAYAKLARGERALATYAELTHGGRVSVRTLMRPEPDIKMIAKVVWDMAFRDVDTRLRRQRKLNRAAFCAAYPPRG